MLEPERRPQRADLGLERSLTDDDEAGRNVAVGEQPRRGEEIGIRLLAAEVGHGRDDDLVGPDPQLRAHRLALLELPSTSSSTMPCTTTSTRARRRSGIEPRTSSLTASHASPSGNVAVLRARLARVWLDQTLCSVETTLGRRDGGIVRTTRRAIPATYGECTWTMSKRSDSSRLRSRSSQRRSCSWRTSKQRVRTPRSSRSATNWVFHGSRYATSKSKASRSRTRARDEQLLGAARDRGP